MGNLESFMGRFGASNSEPAEFIEKPDALAAFTERFAGKSESHWFYDHTIEVRFDPIEHEYFLVDPVLGNLTLLLGVSTVAHIVDRSMALVPWASKMAIEKLLRTVPVTDGRVNLSLEEFTKIALEAKSAHKDKLEDAGEVGHMAHAWIEQLIKARLAKDSARVVDLLRDKCKDERATSACEAMLKWEAAHNVRWRETERKVYSKKHQCSGTMDGLALTDSCSDPTCCRVAFKDHLSLIDWKTSNYLYLEYVFQTSAYKSFRMEEFPEEVIDDIWIIRLGKEDAEFDPWYLGAEGFEEDFNGFLACLNLKRLVNSIEERMKTQKKYTREAKKAVKVAAKELEIAAEKVRKVEAKAEAKRLKQLLKENKC